ncbi:MAG: hypothetical protein B7Z67_10530 [Acidiphilium sp. 21-60-14]|nr:MAG: hypothetical protein B7Z67_10530 [Acidiphilium sp. 21-60-14]OYV91281.1 MAG: hypothetical protein B7Z57_05225 [Acidiphilium sp. 37-60-79]OZB40745.1 MAG: hypothetical protein B7X48_03485 [Acidiphilium sp. 34-60-192]
MARLIVDFTKFVQNMVFVRYYLFTKHAQRVVRRGLLCQPCDRTLSLLIEETLCAARFCSIS